MVSISSARKSSIWKFIFFYDCFPIKKKCMNRVYYKSEMDFFLLSNLNFVLWMSTQYRKLSQLWKPTDKMVIKFKRMFFFFKFSSKIQYYYLLKSENYRICFRVFHEKRLVVEIRSPFFGGYSLLNYVNLFKKLFFIQKFSCQRWLTYINYSAWNAFTQKNFFLLFLLVRFFWWTQTQTHKLHFYDCHWARLF